MKKRMLCLLLAALLLFSAVASAEAVCRIGVMSGPTGMGMAALMNENDGSYAFEIYSAPTNATADLASGALDLLCLPTNTAANLAISKDGMIRVMAINCLGSLYLLTDDTMQITSAADLDGQTLWAGVASSTTGPILEHILSANGVQASIEWEADHDAVIARMIQGDIHIAILPEPKATVALTKAQGWSMALNLSSDWDKVSDARLPMGCIVATERFLQDQPEAAARFMTDYAASVAFIADPANRQESAAMIAAAGVLPSEGIAARALEHLDGSLVCITGGEMKSCLQAFYDVIGQQQPGDGFYAE